MTIGGAVIWAVVFGMAVYAVIGKNRPQSAYFTDRFILAGGVIFPTVVLAALLVFSLRLLPDWRGTESADLRIHVTGEQFWWRVRYEDLAPMRASAQPGATPNRPFGPSQDPGLAPPDPSRPPLPPPSTRLNSFETANQLYLPQGRLVEFALTAEDVIHSFWVPALGGKLDMIPGRTNILRLRPDTVGVFRGVCAEFCGLSHALMAFEVHVIEPEEFDAWHEAEAAPARPETEAERGLALFTRAGCAACHQLRGLAEQGSIGPDLTHFAARSQFGAGTLPLTREALRDWLIRPQTLKPGARMPGYADLPADELEILVNFLMGLK